MPLFHLTDIKNIFRTYDENVAIERLETLLDEYNDIPRVLRGDIRKGYSLTSRGSHCSWEMDLSPKTTNPVENYYRQTDPDQIKEKYKASQGMLSYLARKMQYWTMKLGRCIQHPTSWPSIFNENFIKSNLFLLILVIYTALTSVISVAHSMIGWKNRSMGAPIVVAMGPLLSVASFILAFAFFHCANFLYTPLAFASSISLL